MHDKIVDLTHVLNGSMTVYPDTEGPTIEVLNNVDVHGFAELRLTMVSHTGTHIDAPSHVLLNQRSLDQFLPEKFIGRGLVIPCQDNSEIGLELLQPLEKKIAGAEFILFFTGWQYKWNTKAYFDDCPTPTREAAAWLTKFPLKGIGVDAFSLDKIVPAGKVTRENLPNHYIFLEREILLIENLVNLDRLPASGFTFQCFPLNVEHADGSPVRAVAMIG
jgi:arylformamidase